jgi:hypothetical protein
MKLYTNQTYNRLLFYALPIGLVFSIAIPYYMGKDLVHVLISNIFLYVVIGLGLYSTYKQSQVPIFEINEGDLIVNDVRNGKKVIPLNSITGIRKYMIFSYKLITLYGEISIPLRSLHKKDRHKLLSTLNLHI